MQERLEANARRRAEAEGKDPDDEVDKLFLEDLRSEAKKRLGQLLQNRYNVSTHI